MDSASHVITRLLVPDSPPRKSVSSLAASALALIWLIDAVS